MGTPRFDSPSIFGALLDRRAGSFRVGPYGMLVPLTVRYVPGTMVLETTWLTPSGWMVVRDGLTIGPWKDADAGGDERRTRPPTDQDADHMLVRLIEFFQGSVQVEVICEPMFVYGREPADWTVQDGNWGAAAATCSTGDKLALHSDLRLGIEGSRCRARHTLVEGEKRYVGLGWSTGMDGPRDLQDAEQRLQYTEHYWRDWLAGGRFPDHRWRGHLHRSALTLKGLTYAPTGATVAALTTSLPETPQGERNWDYRYCWMRDATFTLWGLHALGFDWEADDFMQFVADLQRNEDGGLQIMYGVGGERDLAESTLDELGGYEGARPVRIGNGAYDQKQNDVFGAVLDSIYLHTKTGGHIPQRLWGVIQDQVKCAMRDRHWRARARRRRHPLARRRASPRRGRRGGSDRRPRTPALTLLFSGAAAVRQAVVWRHAVAVGDTQVAWNGADSGRLWKECSTLVTLVWRRDVARRAASRYSPATSRRRNTRYPAASGIAT